MASAPINALQINFQCLLVEIRFVQEGSRICFMALNDVINILSNTCSHGLGLKDEDLILTKIFFFFQVKRPFLTPAILNEDKGLVFFNI